ncbi:MAG TPA: hypothetical protein VFQ80_00190, partial [Thermomicrobiales bacterium]|nr:hypothetical protein [Thermomicrobiales bacterium]
MNEARFFDDLRRYWDEIAGGEPVAPGDLDPDLAATIRRLHALGDAAPPDPAYARRLRETLMHASTLPLPTPFPSPPNGVRASDVGAPRSLPFTPRRREPRRVWSLLATAALIALTLAAGFVAIGGIGRNAARPDEPAGIPSLIGTPAPALPPGVASEPPIFQQRLDAIPADANCPLVERETLEPGGTWTMGAIPPAYRGPTVYRIESGSVSVTANGDIQLARAGAAATTVNAGAATTLAAGDTYFTPTDVVTQWRNGGAAPAIVLYAGVVAPSMGNNGVG